MTALTTTIDAAVANVSQSACKANGSTSAFPNADGPGTADSYPSAASGRRTITPRYDRVAARRVSPPAGFTAPPSFARAFTPSGATPTLMSPPPPPGEQRVPDPAGVVH